MTAAERTSYLAQLAGAQRRARREGGEVTHVIWRDGRLSATITPNSRAVESAPPALSRRGVTQGQLF